MSDWAPDIFAVIGLILWGVAAYIAGGEIAILVYVGVVFVILAAAIAWKRST